MIIFLIENMDIEKWGMSGNTITFVTYIIGAIIIGYGLKVGSELNSNKQKIEDQVIINNLEETISELDAENKAKQDSIESMALKLISFSNKIDSNTSTTIELVGEIQKLSNKTSTVAEQIKNEQKERGEIGFIYENIKNYTLKFGTNIFSFDSDNLSNSQNFNVNNILLNIVVKKGKFFIFN